MSYGATNTTSPLNQSQTENGGGSPMGTEQSPNAASPRGHSRQRRNTATMTFTFDDATSPEDVSPTVVRRVEFSGENDEISPDASEPSQHCHVSTHRKVEVDKKARRRLIIASVLCLLFMTAEIVGGVLANSLAVATDAAHLLTDFASFMISLFSIYLAARPATKGMSFGWHRAEVMGALISVLLIWVVTGILFYMAVDRVMSKNYEIDATIMLIIAGIGIAFNVVMLFTLHDTHGHGHSHGGGGGHSHGSDDVSDVNQPLAGPEGSVSVVIAPADASAPRGSQDEAGERDRLLGEKPEGSDAKKKATNINVRAAFIHVLGDLLQSVGVLIAAVVIYYKPDYKIADPICTFLFSFLVLFTTISILRDTLNVLMEGTPSGMSFSDVRDSLVSIPGVKEVHNLRLWSLTTTKTAVAVHLAVAADVDHQKVSQKAGFLLRDQFGIYECTVQTEQFVDEMKDCTQCQDPQD